jgi:hypothetical protein
VLVLVLLVLLGLLLLLLLLQALLLRLMPQVLKVQVQELFLELLMLALLPGPGAVEALVSAMAVAVAPLVAASFPAAVAGQQWQLVWSEGMPLCPLPGLPALALLP